MTMRFVAWVPGLLGVLLGCSSTKPAATVQHPRFDCSPGRPVAMGVGDAIGTQLYASLNPGLAVASGRADPAAVPWGLTE